MDMELAKPLYAEYFLSIELLSDIRNILPWPYLQIDGKRVSKANPEPILQSIWEKAKKLGINQSHFGRLLATHIKSLIARKRPTKSLENFVISHIKEVEDRISTIPNTLDKARDALLALIEVEALKDFMETDQVYDAMVLLRGRVPPEIIKKVVRNWKKEAKLYQEEVRKGLYSEASDIFWVSRDFMETIDGVSRYRFREYFGIGEFEPASAEVESMLGFFLMEGTSGAEAITVQFWGDVKLTSVAFDLWLASRSRNLPNRIRDVVNIALRRIATWQSQEGWWTDFQLAEPPGKDPRTGLERSKFLPNTYLTALCSLDLLKLSISEPMRKKGILGARWLLEKQNPDGSWSREYISKNGIEVKPDIFVTLLALEAIARSGIENLDHSIKLGADWIIQQQNNLGMWDDEGFPFPFMTVIVLEFLESIQSKALYPNRFDPYLSMSKGFLNRSIQFSLEENSNSHRLAIIAAFQGIEAFLYSLLATLNIKIFEKKNKTIGMSKALTLFQEYLQKKKEIKQNEVIPHRNSLDRLAYLRDEVVHKAVDVTQEECRLLVEEALKFASEYSFKIFGFDIFA